MYSPIKIFESTGITPRKYTRSALCKIDNIKIYEEELKVQTLSKEAPKKNKGDYKKQSKIAEMIFQDEYSLECFKYEYIRKFCVEILKISSFYV